MPTLDKLTVFDGEEIRRLSRGKYDAAAERRTNLSSTDVGRRRNASR